MRKCIACAGCLLLVFATAAAAQDPTPREGFWIGFGLGVGSAGLECDVCPDDRENGGAGFLRLGGTPGERFLVGGEINGWTWNDDDEEDTPEITTGAIFGTVLYYPSETAGFYLQGGLGFMGLLFETDEFEIETSGFGVLVGAGYDIRVAVASR